MIGVLMVFLIPLCLFYHASAYAAAIDQKSFRTDIFNNVVRIQSSSLETIDEKEGSGILFNNGYVLTSYSLLPRGTDIIFGSLSNFNITRLKVVEILPQFDLMLLQFQTDLPDSLRERGFNCIRADEPRAKERIVVADFRGPNFFRGLGNVHDVKATRARARLDSFPQGMIGSPVFDENGRLIGVTTESEQDLEFVPIRFAAESLLDFAGVADCATARDSVETVDDETADGLAERHDEPEPNLEDSRVDHPESVEVPSAKLTEPALSVNEFTDQMLKRSARSRLVHLTIRAEIEKDGMRSGNVSYSTAFLINDKGYAITSSHVFPKEATSLRVEARLGNPFSTEFFSILDLTDRHDPRMDFYVIRVIPNKAEFKFLYFVLSNSDKYSEGESFRALGFPEELDLATAPLIFDSEIAKGGRWQMSGATSVGMSGSPIFDKYGCIAAMVPQGTSGTNVTLGRPINDALRELTGIEHHYEEDGCPTRPPS